MFIKFSVFLLLLLTSFSLFACGGSSSSVLEGIILILCFGLVLACFYILPLSVIMFNVANSSSYIWLFSAYFIGATITITALFFVPNNTALYLSLLLCIFCSLPSFHAAKLAYKNNQAKKRAAD